MDTRTIEPLPASLLLFQHFTISEIAERSTYSEQYLVGVRASHGDKPLSKLFRRRMANAFRIPESILFSIPPSPSAEEGPA